MNEVEYLTSNDPLEMCVHLSTTEHHRLLFRLFVAASARLLYELEGDRTLLLAAQAVEDYVNDLTETKFQRICHFGSPFYLAPYDAARSMILNESLSSFHAEQAGILRCIFGNPFRPFSPANVSTPEALDWYSIFEWNEGTVPRMAKRIYDEYDFAALSILADALEEAGCKDKIVLSHCRSEPILCEKCLGVGGWKQGVPGKRKWTSVQWQHPCFSCNGKGRFTNGPHFRGCWVIEFLRGAFLV